MSEGVIQDLVEVRWYFTSPGAGQADSISSGEGQAVFASPGES